MDTRYGYASILALAVAVSIGGCNSDWTDRVPEVAAEPSSESKTAPNAQAGAIPDVGAHVGTQAAESVSDAALSSKVESALKSEPDLHGSAISVRSHEGVVTLSGTAKDPQLRSMAAQVALSIEGVKLVRNEIALGQEA
jgi:hyperosmotically inducible periplasmic protein